MNSAPDAKSTASTVVDMMTAVNTEMAKITVDVRLNNHAYQTIDPETRRGIEDPLGCRPPDAAGAPQQKRSFEALADFDGLNPHPFRISPADQGKVPILEGKMKLHIR